MNKKHDNIDKNEVSGAFESLFGDDSKISNDAISINTNIEVIFKHNVSDLAKGRLSFDRKRLMLECDFLIKHDIPKLDKENAKFNCDEFSIFFAALCAIYYQFYISALCCVDDGKKKLDIIKNKLILCIKMLTQEYKECYNGEAIDPFISRYDLYKDSWHKKKAESLSIFFKKFNASNEDFPYVLFFCCTYFFKYGYSPIINRDLYRISLFCAYHYNINRIYKSADNFFLERLIEYKNNANQSSDNLKLIIEKNTAFDQFYGKEETSSFFWNLDDIIAILSIDNAIKMAKVHYEPLSDKEKDSPRLVFVQQEKSIISLIKRCFGKSFCDYGKETESREQVVAYLRTTFAMPQSVIKRFPSIAFFIYWSISFVKYNEFKSLFIENANKPEAYRVDDNKHLHIKASEYKKFVKNDFVPIPKENEQSNQASILQDLLFFALLDLANISKLGNFLLCPDKNKKLVENFKAVLMDSNSSWHNPQRQLELLNELLENNELPIIGKTVDFRLFDGQTGDKGFSRTESAINLIYNIITFTTINPENGIVQQVNHLDELRNRTFGYHSEKITSWNSIKEPEQNLYKKEFDKMQSIDCGFDINEVFQSNLTNHWDGCLRNFKCKVFSESDTSCVTMEKNSKPYRQLYRSLLSTLYIKPARNMHVHYSPFNPTEKLLELRNFNDLLGILYDIKDRIENESILFSVADTYKEFAFHRKGAFSVDGEQDSLHKLLQEVFAHIINSESAYVQNISKKNEKYVVDPIPFNQLFCAAKAKDEVFKSIHEKTRDICKYKDRLKEIPTCFTILKDRQKNFMEFVFIEWKKQDYRAIITSLDCLKRSFSAIYWEALPSETPTREEKDLHGLIYYKIEAWESFFEWKTVQKDLKIAKMALEKLDYFKEGIAQVINIDNLDSFSTFGDYNLFEKEVREIAKQLPIFILFKNIYSRRNESDIHEEDNFALSRNDNELLHYKWYQNDINEIAKEKDTSEMKKYLEFIDYEILKNEYYYPNSPKYKIDFIKFLVDIDSLISLNFTDDDLMTFSKELSEKARKKLTMIQKEVDLKSIDVFENSPTYNIYLLEITKSLLQRTICYLTSLEIIRTKLNGKPLLNTNGEMPFSKEDLLGDKRKDKIGIKNVFDSEKYENPLREDLQKFLNFIFGVAGHYQRNDDIEIEKTLLELYGDRFFLYLLRVTFEMSQLKDNLENVS